ncbi:hypothetical protein WDU94_011091 [Cyamophila willieti]
MAVKLTFTVQLGDDIRRIGIPDETLTYGELLLIVEEIFRKKLGSRDKIIIKYKDEDGDLKRISDSSVLLFAIQHNQMLKLKIFPGVGNSRCGSRNNK